MIVALLATWATLSSTEIGTHVGPLGRRIYPRFGAGSIPR